MNKTEEKTTYKIVDTFNGWEGNEYETQAEAEAEVSRRRRAWKNHMGSFRLGVVSRECDWKYNYVKNKYEWRE